MAFFCYNYEILKNSTLRYWQNLTVAVWLLMLPVPAFAQAWALVAEIEAQILPQIIIAIEGVALIALFYYGVRMILQAQNENVLTEARKSFIYAIVGFACLAAMYRIADAFIFATPFQPVNPVPFNEQLSVVGAYLVRIAEGILVLNTVFNAFRLMTSQGDEGAAEKARKAIIQNIIGVVLIFLADVGMRAVGAADNGQLIIIQELAGLANFILELIAAVSIIAILVAGILLIISVDESLKDRAKRIITGTLITLVIVIASYTLINIFI